MGTQYGTQEATRQMLAVMLADARTPAVLALVLAPAVLALLADPFGRARPLPHPPPLILPARSVLLPVFPDHPLPGPLPVPWHVAARAAPPQSLAVPAPSSLSSAFLL